MTENKDTRDDASITSAHSNSAWGYSHLMDAGNSPRRRAARSKEADTATNRESTEGNILKKNAACIASTGKISSNKRFKTEKGSQGSKTHVTQKHDDSYGQPNPTSIDSHNMETADAHGVHGGPSKSTSRYEHFKKFGFRSKTPEDPACQQQLDRHRFVHKTARFQEEEADVQRKKFAWCMENQGENQFRFKKGDMVVFLSESCYRKGQVTELHRKPIGLDMIPPDMCEIFRDYTVEKFPMQQYVVKFCGCTHEDDNYHLEYIPVYEIFPLVPKSENDAKMLLLAHHWNFCEPLENPLAHNKSRFESFFRLKPQEYLYVEEKWHCLAWPEPPEREFLEYLENGKLHQARL